MIIYFIIIDGVREFCCLQVEVNIGPIGGPGCATQLAKLHGKVLQRLAAVRGGEMPILAKAQKPEMRARQRIARTLYQAW